MSAYAGDLSPTEAWELLRSDPQARLVDVRTVPEWTYVGLPDLSATGKDPVLREWQRFPEMAVDSGFVDAVAADLDRQGVPGDAPLLFLCRSGARSRAAAIAMTAAGRPRCFNIANGFEGPIDAGDHRGTVRGWKASGLPWRQN